MTRGVAAAATEQCGERDDRAQLAALQHEQRRSCRSAKVRRMLTIGVDCDALDPEVLEEAKIGLLTLSSGL